MKWSQRKKKQFDDQHFAEASRFAFISKSIFTGFHALVRAFTIAALNWLQYHGYSMFSHLKIAADNSDYADQRSC